MDPRSTSHVKKPKIKKGGREATFFGRLTGTTVQIEKVDGRTISGKLLWVGPYSLIILQRGVERLYWKHALADIGPANGRGEE
jgi:hypothetical protein